MPKTKTEKRLDAQARQVARVERSTDEQLALLDARPGDAFRERVKLTASVQL